MLGRSVLVILVLALAGPPLLLLIYRVAPPPVTPLMLIRLAQGEGLQQTWRPLDEIAPALADAVIAAEDNRFCEHGGFDWEALGSVYEAYQSGKERPRGASTITMQTAKNLFLWPGRSMLRKVFEFLITPQIELLWPKHRIMAVYLNIVELGPGIYGAEAAAQAFFNKPAAKLTGREAALLAAVLPNPRRWSAGAPTNYIERRALTIAKRIRQLGPLLACVQPG